MTPKGFENRAFRNTDPVSLIARSVSARTSYPAFACARQGSFATRSAGSVGDAVTAIVSLARIQADSVRPVCNWHGSGGVDAGRAAKGRPVLACPCDLARRNIEGAAGIA